MTAERVVQTNWKAFYRRAPTVAVMVGLLAVVLPMVLMDENSRHPGVVTLVPVLGSALVIWFGGDNSGSIVLRQRPVVFIGLISYSLYLWHQPIFVFGRLFSGDALTVWDYLPLIALSFAAAWVSWRYIESPFRTGSVIGKRQLAASMSGAAVALLGLSAGILAFQGFPARLPELVRSAATVVVQQRLVTQDGEVCYIREVADRCIFQNGSSDRPWALIGDSHAAMLSPTLLDQLVEASLPFEMLARSGCMYVPGFTRLVDNGCADHNAAVRQHLLNGPPTTILFAGRLAGYISGDRFDNNEGGVEPGGKIPMVPVSGAPGEVERVEMLRQGIINSLQELVDAGHRLVLIYPVPEVGWDVPAALSRVAPMSANALEDWLDNGGIDTSLHVFNTRNEAAYEVLDNVVGDNVLRIYPAESLCRRDTARCITHTRDVVYYSDNDHLTRAGAELVLSGAINILTEQKR
jgi:hypothetical protein